MIFKDDRTDEEKETHSWLVIMTDAFMSGWGHAYGGNSYAVWACRPEDYDKVDTWVRSRDEARRVRFTVDMPGSRYRPSARSCAHCHIYVVNPGHSALAA